MSFGIPVRNGLSISLLSTTALSSGRGYNTSLALNLDFLTGTLDPRITFSRGSQATVTDATGKLTYAPNNLLTNSEDFEAAAWLKLSGGTGSAPVITSNAGIAPNGTTTADRLVLNRGSGTTSNDLSRIFQGAVITSGVGIFSVWLRSFDGVSSFAITLTNGSVSSNITVTGNWQRFSLVSSNTTANAQVRLQGDVGPQTADLLVWGAQLEQVTYQTTPGTYNSTSPKNLLGYTQEFDNAAWTKSNAFVQTNLLTYSQALEISNANVDWENSSSALAITANSVAAPDGTLTADTLAQTAVTAAFVNQQRKTLVASTTYTISTYVRNVDINFVALAIFGAADNAAYAEFNLTTGALSRSGANGTGWAVNSTSIQSVGGSWYRIAAVITTGTNVSTPRQRIMLTDGTTAFTASGTVTFTGTSKSAYFWGAQLVQGSTAGDYQRTDAAAAAVQYTAPDGSRTADKLVENTATAQHYVSQMASGLVANTPITVSVYLKAAERSIARVINYDGGSNFYGLYINLATGAFISTDAGGSYTNASYSITSAGDGWWRVAVTASIAGTGRLLFVNSAVTGPNATYTGDGTSGIYIWGAQLSNSASLDAYSYNPAAAPTSAAYYGPRFDYDPIRLTPKGLLIEEQRTNILTYSDQFDNAIWGKTNSTIAANVIISPDGTVNADKLQEDSATAGHVLVANPTMAASTTYTLSVYMKAAERTFGVMNIYTGAASCWTWFNLSTGVVSTLGAGATATITPAGNGWYRCTLTIATAATGTPNVAFWPANANGSLSYAGTAGSGIYIYGAQLEAGSFATSYIPTVASQVTRTADQSVMTGANITNWFNQNEGTFVFEADVIAPSIGNKRIIGVNATPASFGFVSNTSVYGVFDGTTALTANTVSANTAFKASTAYDATNKYVVLSGGSVVTVARSTTYPLTPVSALQLGWDSSAPNNPLNGHLIALEYYNTRLSNTALPTVTAPNTIPSLSLDFTTQVFNVG